MLGLPVMAASSPLRHSLLLFVFLALFHAAAAADCSISPGQRITFYGPGLVSGSLDLLNAAGDFTATEYRSIPGSPSCQLALNGTIAFTVTGFLQDITECETTTDCQSSCALAPVNGTLTWDSNCKGGTLDLGTEAGLTFKVSLSSAAALASSVFLVIAALAMLL